MTPEQLLLIAREFCRRYGATVTDYAALVAAASASTAKIDGISAHASRAQAAAALRRVLEGTPPVSKHGDFFALTCERVFVALETRTT
ncbi:cell filamentation protein Fic [uncultured Corynebacterium sp.]|uniref:cell filamentation protein Fic n=1 Tax=uncultured Corynebacterium sp. TaxID=159447 RepID=UPI0025F7868B|nr:cell filamentation protein Fic [uncultured Corynebacterium sp.]